MTDQEYYTKVLELAQVRGRVYADYVSVIKHKNDGLTPEESASEVIKDWESQDEH